MRKIAVFASGTGTNFDAIQKAMNNEIPIIGFDSGVPDAPEGSRQPHKQDLPEAHGLLHPHRR